MSSETSTYFDTLLYFYSTAPQVLGAILAISGAFVALKIDTLKREISNRLEDIIRNKEIDASNRGHSYRAVINNENFTNLKESIVENNYNDILNILQGGVDNIDAANVRHRDYIEIEFHYVINRIKIRNRFITRTRNTYIINSIILALLMSGFFIIPRINDFLGSQHCFANKLLIAGFFLTCISLGLIVRYLLVSLRDRT